MGVIESTECEKLNALIEINERINTSYTDVNALLVYILESAMKLVECESSSLLLVNKSDSMLHFCVALGPKGAEVKNYVVSKESIAGWVASNNQPLIINDVANDPRFNSNIQQKTGYLTKSMIAIPMQVKNVCLGVIELINKSSGEFADKDLELLTIFANQAAIAYSNADTYKTAKNRIDDLEKAVKKNSIYHEFVYKSRVVKDILAVIDELAKTNSSVLIMGESGVGKELFAEQLHIRSNRSTKPFIRVNCAALNPSLLESELFGHVKGAFTSAVSSQKGRFESADGGTIFLDEIGELPLDLQSKLLRVLQSRQFERVGSSETITVDVRVIAATNRNLEEMVNLGTFRSDLYYRLNVFPLNIPPLRQRTEDIDLLADFFLEKMKLETKKNFEGFSEGARTALRNYYWPGNVRELENTIERACVLGKVPLIHAQDLRIPGASEKLEYSTDMTLFYQNQEVDKTLKTALNAFKKSYVTKILEENNWNQTETAKVLDVTRTYITKLMSDLNISAK